MTETDVRLSIAGRSMKVDAGGANIPGGEFFGCPLEDSAEGVITFTEFPAVYAGREMPRIRLRFEGGRVVEASADTNEDFLLETLDQDEGARRLGELGIGCNPGITRYMKNTLFDEKIDGTVHLALGNSIPDSAGRTCPPSTGTSSRTSARRGPDRARRRGRPTGRRLADLSGRVKHLLRQRSIAALITAEVISSLGSQMTFLALPWFVLATTGSATKMGIVLAASCCPWRCSGSRAARSSRGSARAGRCSTATSPVRRSWPRCRSCTHSASSRSRCCSCSRRAARRLPRPVLLRAATRPAGARWRRRARRRAGERRRRGRPAGDVAARARVTAGLLIALVGAPKVLYIDAATFLVSFALLALFVPQRRAARAGGRQPRASSPVIRFMLRDRLLRVLGGTALLANGFGQMLVAGLPVLAYEEFGGSSRVAGAFFAAFGAGAVLGSIVAMQLVGHVRAAAARRDVLRPADAAGLRCSGSSSRSWA